MLEFYFLLAKHRLSRTISLQSQHHSVLSQFLWFFSPIPITTTTTRHPKSLPSARTSGFCLQRRDTGQCRDEVSIDLNPTKKDLLIQEFIVVMKQHRCVVHGRKANCRATCLKYIGRRSNCQKARPEKVSHWPGACRKDIYTHCSDVAAVSGSREDLTLQLHIPEETETQWQRSSPLLFNLVFLQLQKFQAIQR